MSTSPHRPAHPPFFAAVAADARMTLLHRSEPADLSNRWRTMGAVIRLTFTTDAFFAQVCYRAKARLRGLRIPVLPLVFHRLAMMSAQVCIGDPVLVEPGIYIAHGQVVVDGITTVRSGTVLLPWITIGLTAGNFQGPTIGKRVTVGTGAKILGPVKVGKGAKIGAKEWRIARAELMRFMGEDGNNGSKRATETVNAVRPAVRAVEDVTSKIEAADDEDPNAPWEFEGLFELVGIAEGAPPDMSSNVDKYLAEAYAE